MEERRLQSSHYIKKQTMKTGVFPDGEERVKVGKKWVPVSFLPAQILSNACEFGIYIVFTVEKIWNLLEIWIEGSGSFSAGFGALLFILLNKESLSLKKYSSKNSQFHDFADETLFLTLTLYASGSPGFCWSRMDTKSLVW